MRVPHRAARAHGAVHELLRVHMPARRREPRALDAGVARRRAVQRGPRAVRARRGSARLLHGGPAGARGRRHGPQRVPPGGGEAEPRLRVHAVPAAGQTRRGPGEAGECRARPARVRGFELGARRRGRVPRARLAGKAELGERQEQRARGAERRAEGAARAVRGGRVHHGGAARVPQGGHRSVRLRRRAVRRAVGQALGNVLTATTATTEPTR